MKHTRISPSIASLNFEDKDARKAYLEGNPSDVIYVPILPDEAAALMHATDNSLTDPDFRRDHMTARQRKLADSLAQTLDLVARQRSSADRRVVERRKDERRQMPDETSPLRRMPKLRRVKVKRRYHDRRKP